MSINIELKQFAQKASPVAADIFYVGDSANNFDEVQCTLASIAGASGTTTPTPNTLPLWDANNNLSANNFLPGLTIIPTAASTTTLTVSSSYIQLFTGSTTQTVLLPVVTTLALGQPFFFVNSSSGTVTIESSGTNTVLSLTTGNSAIIFCIALTGTSATSWQVVSL